MTLWRLSGRPRIFVDTSGFFASLNERDANHEAARAITSRLVATQAELVTTNFTVAEAHALMMRRLGHRAGLLFLDSFAGGNTSVIRASINDESHAIDIIRRYTDKDFSLTDAISFAIMERLGITQAFSFDSDFAQYGFNILRP